MKKAYILLLVLSLMTAACSGKKSGSDGDAGPTPAGPVPPPPGGGGTPTPPVYNTGATADLTIDMSVFDEYTGRVANAPSNFKINVDLHDVDPSPSSRAYGGTVKISYQETDSSGNPVYYPGANSPGFKSGTSIPEARYNGFVTHGSAEWFKGFFEDAMGGLVIVVDSVDEFGRWSGKVFFRNFECGRNAWDPPCNPDRPKRCWLVSAGPYQCAAFATGGWNGAGEPNINMSSVMYPNGALQSSSGYKREGYTLLGTFTQMNSNQALNIP